MNRQQLFTLFVILALGFGAASARSDTTYVQGPAAAVVNQKGVLCDNARNCFDRLHPAIPMVARAKPGQQIVYENPGSASTAGAEAARN